MRERWMPEHGDTFWYVSEFAEVYGTTWVDDEIDPVFYESGNCFRTAEEAEAAAEKVKALLLSLHDNNLATNLQDKQDKLQDKPLPKLTAEVFDRPDCPEDAKIAVVNDDGSAYWGSCNTARQNFRGGWDGENGSWFPIPGKWDSSDWQNSLIERPSKAAFDKLLKNCAEQQADKILQKARKHRLSEQYHNAPEETKLPKLTAEVFDRPDCPEWAKYAAVREDGIAIWFEVKPNIGRDYPANKFWYSTWNSKNIPGEWDASDWQNSLIERPAKLPGWCWNGALGWENGDYFRLEVIDADHQVTMKYLDDGVEESVIAGYIAEHVKQARLRPYNADEIPKLPFEVSEINSDFRTIVVSCKGDKIWLGGASTAISTEELMRDFTIDGKPCGVLEHLENGEWVQQ